MVAVVPQSLRPESARRASPKDLPALFESVLEVDQAIDDDLAGAHGVQPPVQTSRKHGPTAKQSSGRVGGGYRIGQAEMNLRPTAQDIWFNTIRQDLRDHTLRFDTGVAQVNANRKAEHSRLLSNMADLHRKMEANHDTVLDAIARLQNGTQVGRHDLMLKEFAQLRAEIKAELLAVRPEARDHQECQECQAALERPVKKQLQTLHQDFDKHFLELRSDLASVSSRAEGLRHCEPKETKAELSATQNEVRAVQGMQADLGKQVQDISQELIILRTPLEELQQWLPRYSEVFRIGAQEISQLHAEMKSDLLARRPEMKVVEELHIGSGSTQTELQLLRQDFDKHLRELRRELVGFQKSPAASSEGSALHDVHTSLGQLRRMIENMQREVAQIKDDPILTEISQGQAEVLLAVNQNYTDLRPMMVALKEERKHNDCMPVLTEIQKSTMHISQLIGDTITKAVYDSKAWIEDDRTRVDLAIHHGSSGGQHRTASVRRHASVAARALVSTRPEAHA